MLIALLYFLFFLSKFELEYRLLYKPIKKTYDNDFENVLLGALASWRRADRRISLRRILLHNSS